MTATHGWSEPHMPHMPHSMRGHQGSTAKGIGRINTTFSQALEARPCRSRELCRAFVAARL